MKLYQIKKLTLFFFSVSFAIIPLDGFTREHRSSAPLTEIPIEKLMDITVVSASKKEKILFQTATAIFVITADDIKRLGILSVMEALRMAPGVQVTRSDSQTYAITARGFSQGAFANKMLVLIDGRSVYSPLFAGVFWDVQDILIDNIDRIEVIRGPGGALWGANAVNGVINIITKHSGQTPGLFVTGGGGLQERAFGAIRYGSNFKNGGTWRVNSSYFNRDNFSENPTHLNALDDWYMSRTGFRMDWEKENFSSLMIEGDFYAGDGGVRSTVPTLTAPFTANVSNDADLWGGHLLSRWQRFFSNTSKLSLSSYYDHTSRNTDVFRSQSNLMNIEAQYDFNWGERNALSTGLGYRLIDDRVANQFLISADNSKNQIHLLQTFIQDEISLVKEKLALTLGTKLELNSYTNFEWQPSGRLLFTPNKKNTFWFASSRAVRTPSRLEDNLRLNANVIDTGGGTSTWVSLIGNPGFDSEKLWANELGYRVQPLENLSIDIATFYNRYSDLRTIETGAPFLETSFGTTHTVTPFSSGNLMAGNTYGFEFASEWQVFKRWKLAGAYSFLKMNMHLDSSSTDPISIAQTVGASPKHQFNIRSYLDLPHNIEFDTAIYFVDKLATSNTPRFARVDARIGWKPTPKVSLSLIGQNLFDSRHPELVQTTHSKEVDRAVYGKFTLQF